MTETTRIATLAESLATSNSAIQIIRPLESIAAMQLQLHSGFAEMVSNDFPVLHTLQETFLLTDRPDCFDVPRRNCHNAARREW